MDKLSVFRSLAYAWGLHRRSTTATQTSNSKLNSEIPQGRYDGDTSTGNDETLQLQASPKGDTLTSIEQSDTTLSCSDTVVSQLPNSTTTVPSKPGSIIFQRGDQTQRERDISRIAVAFVLGGSMMLKDIFILLTRLFSIQHKVSFSRINNVTEFAKNCGPHIIKLGEIYGKDIVESSPTVMELLSLLQDLCAILSTLPIEDPDEQKGADIDRLVSTLNDKLSEIQKQYPRICGYGIDQDIQQHSTVDVILEASVTILDLVRDGGDLIPVVCVKPAVGLACALIKAVKRTRTNHQDMHDLSESVSEFVISIVVFLSENNVEIQQPIESALQEFNSSLQYIVETCLMLANKSFISRFLQQGKDSDTIGGLKSKLHMAIEKFQLKSHILQGFNFDIVTRSISDKLDYEVFRSLPSNPLFEGKREDFLPDIQEDILKHIATWIEDESSSPVFLLLAGAGLGKSCISHQLVYQLMDSGRLAAQMFMNRGSVLQQNLVAILQTLARDLGTMHPGTVSKIATATRLGGSSHDSPAVYFRKYILEPIRSLSLSQPLILILDALDECEARKLILQVILEISDFSGIKIILTSRPGSPDITEFTKSPSVVTVNLKRMTQSKMELYISSRFKKIAWVQESPPSENDISNLAKLADGLIIWASTSCNLIENDVQEDDPSVILQKIISSSSDISSDDQLQSLYNTTLMHLFGRKQAERFSQVFRMMLVVNESMSVETFSRAFGISVRQIKAVHSALSALEIYESDDKDIILPAITRFHSSFLEYITQPYGSSSTLTDPFYINPTIAHCTVSTICLSQIHILATSNSICWETISYAGLDSHIQYAVCHWPFHLINSVQVDSYLETPARKGIDTWYPFYLLASQALSLILEGTSHRRAIDKVISFHTHSWQLFDVTGKDKSEASSDYGLALWRRYERDGSLQDLEESIKMQNVFLSLHQTSDIRRAHALSRLGHSIWSRIPTTKSCPQDIDDAVSKLNEALKIYTTLSFSHYRTLSALSSALRARFDKTGNDADLDHSITIRKDLLNTASTDDFIDPIRARNNLANCLVGRFESKKLMSDLNEAISLLDNILTCRPIGHPFRSVTLNNLAGCLERRYDDTGCLEDLEKAILMNDEALKLRPHPHTYRAQTLTNLSSCLKSRYDYQGALSDLEKSISRAREATELRPASHLYHHFTVNRLGQYLHCRFMHSNEPEDLDEAIMLLTGAISSYHSSHREYPMFQSSLGVALRTRYEETAAEDDLDYALAMQRQALASSSKQTVFYPMILSQLGTTLLISYTRKRSSELLTEIIKINREANSLRVESHPYRHQGLNNLAKSLHYAFQEAGRQEDLDEARALYHESLLLCPPPHPSRHIALEGLAQLAQSYFDLTDSLEHLDEWIDRCRVLFTLVSSSSARYKITAEGYQKALHIRFERKGDSKDLDEISH